MPELPGHSSAVVDVRILPDERAASGDSEGQVRVWDIRTGELLWVHRAHFGSLSAMTVDHEGRLWTAGVDGRILAWSRDGSGPTSSWTLPYGPVRALVAGPGFVVASDGVELWRREADDRTSRLPVAYAEAIVSALACDDSGTKLAIGLVRASVDPRSPVTGEDGNCAWAKPGDPILEPGPRARVDEVRVVDLPSGRELALVETPGARARLAWRGDRLMFVDGKYSSIAEWNLGTRERSSSDWVKPGPLRTRRNPELGKGKIDDFTYVAGHAHGVTPPFEDDELVARAVGSRALIASDGRDFAVADGLGNVAFGALDGEPGSWMSARACVADRRMDAATVAPLLASSGTDGGARSWIRVWNWREGSVVLHFLHQDFYGDYRRAAPTDVTIDQLDLDASGRWLAWTRNDHSGPDDRLRIDDLLAGGSVELVGSDPDASFSTVALFAFRPGDDVLVALTSDALTEEGLRQALLERDDTPHDLLLAEFGAQALPVRHAALGWSAQESIAPIGHPHFDASGRWLVIARPDSIHRFELRDADRFVPEARGRIELAQPLDPTQVVVNQHGQVAAILGRAAVRFDFDRHAVTPVSSAARPSALAWQGERLLLGVASGIEVRGLTGELLDTIPTGTAIARIVPLDDHPAALGSDVILTLDHQGLALRRTCDHAELRLFACDEMPMSGYGHVPLAERSTSGVMAVWREPTGAAGVRVGVDDEALHPWLAPGHHAIELEPIHELIAAFLRAECG